MGAGLFSYAFVFIFWFLAVFLIVFSPLFPQLNLIRNQSEIVSKITNEG
jgi:hypothetical protein